MCGDAIMRNRVVKGVCYRGADVVFPYPLVVEDLRVDQQAKCDDSYDDEDDSKEYSLCVLVVYVS